VADPFNRPVTEADQPHPREIYGSSKWEAEKVLQSFAGRVQVAIIRTPTIIDSGRLGLLAILFEFIAEGRRVWVVAGGSNRYQFVYAPDLADACVRAMRASETGVFNVGSDNVPTVREAYQYVIDRAATGARIASLAKWPTLPLMKVAYSTGMSPLGPYQYRMIAESFVFDTTRIKRDLAWSQTVTNGEMLYLAYDYYQRHRMDIEARSDVSAHKRPARMGVIRLLKWIS
jgi:nucleoside-diphosphate-sugar epimerase